MAVFMGLFLQRASRPVRSLVLTALAAVGLSAMAPVWASPESAIYLKPSVGTLSYQTDTRYLESTGDNGCELNTSAISDLLVIEGTGTDAKPGWTSRDGVIGVNGTSSGSPCTQVRIDQGVKVSVAENFVSPRFASATIRLKANPKATVRIQTFNGNDLVHNFVISCNKVCTVQVNEANALSSNNASWDSVTITSITGNRSSESGAFALADSEFNWAQGDLDCLDSVQSGAGSGGSNATLTRLFGINEDVSCTKIPYRLDFDGETVEFLADYGVLDPEVEPAFAVDLIWGIEFVTATTPAAQAFDSAFDPNPPAYLAIGTPPSTFVQAVPLSVQWFNDADRKYFLDYCPGQPTFAVADDPASLNKLDFPPGFDSSTNDMADLPGFQFGCLVNRAVQIVGDSVACPQGADVTGPDAICVTVKETVYLRGDWTATRTLSQ